MSKITQEKVDTFREEKIAQERFTLIGIIKDFFFNLMHLERKRFFYTAWDLTITPGKSIHKYVDGYRQYLYQPGEYLFVSGAVILFLTIRYKFFASDFTDTITSFGFLLEHKEFFTNFFLYAEEYATIVNVVTIPVYTFLSWLFFINTRHNVAENLIMNTFITAQQLLFLVALVPLLELFPYTKSEIMTFYSIAVVLYNIWVYIEFFEDKFFPKVIKAVFINALAFPIQFVANVSFYYLFEPILKYLPQL
ncbi:MAG: DUF3667 domain-containing protein [Bacteroidota bacterium]|nr:DUF3667 domain-containing protein [Bacteroidota bacterium]